jgi:hypothetical protein
VALELEERCHQHTFGADNADAENYGGWLRRLFGAFASRKPAQARRKVAAP